VISPPIGLDSRVRFGKLPPKLAARNPEYLLIVL
jgi:hypothetical protein